LRFGLVSKRFGTACQLLDFPGEAAAFWRRTMSTNQPDNDIVRVATAPNPTLAHIWEQALRAEGIQSRVVGDYLEAGLGNIPGMKAEVWVHRDDLARAEEILRRSQDVSGEETEEAAE
jgi:hypothetical protein